MNSKANIPYIRYYLSELIILLLATFIFSSKITFIPWYSKPRTYDLLYILILMIVQFIAFLLYWRGYEKYNKFNNLRYVSGIESCILFVIFMMCIYSINWYVICSIVFTIINIGLIAYIIYTQKNKGYH